MTNSIQQSIRMLIAHATGQAPVGFDDLVKKLGINHDIVQAELDVMYQNRSVNQCLHTKNGVTQMVYYPTAIIDKADKFTIGKISPDYKGSQPRRSEQPRSTPIAQETPAMTTAELNTQNDAIIIDPSQPRVWRMIKLIATKGKADSVELAALIGERYSSNIPGYLTSYTTGEKAILKVARGVDDNNRPIYVYSMLEGKTFDDYLNRKVAAHSNKRNGQRKLNPKTEAKIAQNIIESGADTKDDTPKIPAFLLKTDDLAVADSIDEKLGTTPTQRMVNNLNAIKRNPAFDSIFDTSFDEAAQPLQHLNNPEFKVAITSAGTVMLFGIECLPIELNPADTRTLVDFINSSDIESML